MLVGVISDTHGRFHPAIPTHFAGVEHILHAGDIGNARVITQLAALAPITAVTGNVDWGGPLDRDYQRIEQITLGDCTIYMTHIGGRPAKLISTLPTPTPQVYIFGHSHVALVEELNGVLFLNPGSAGPARFGKQPSLALLTIEDGQPRAEIVQL
jgi:putative phosphoesterase